MCAVQVPVEKQRDVSNPFLRRWTFFVATPKNSYCREACKKIPTVGNSFHCKGRNLYTEIVNFSQAFLPSGGKKNALDNAFYFCNFGTRSI